MPIFATTIVPKRTAAVKNKTMKTRRVYFTTKSDVENHSSRGIQGIRVGGRTLFLLEFLPEKFEGKILVEQVEEKKINRFDRRRLNSIGYAKALSAGRVPRASKYTDYTALSIRLVFSVIINSISPAFLIL